MMSFFKKTGSLLVVVLGLCVLYFGLKKTIQTHSESPLNVIRQGNLSSASQSGLPRIPNSIESSKSTSVQHLKPHNINIENTIDDVKNKQLKKQNIDKVIPQSNIEGVLGKKELVKMAMNSEMKKFSGYIRDDQDQWELIPDMGIMNRNELSPEIDTENLWVIGDYVVVKGKNLNSDRFPQLIFNSNQKNFSVLSGRLIVKFKNSLSHVDAEREYDLILNNANVDIKTFFYTPKISDGSNINNIVSEMSKDFRIENVRYEIIQDLWVKN